MNLPAYKTKIVCTIGPGSRNMQVMESMIKSGMNVARLNFSHGDFAEHTENIKFIRAAAAKHGKYVSIIMDLPGVKMRIGKLKDSEVTLKTGQSIILTTKQLIGDINIISVSFKGLPKSVRPGSTIYLSDGFIQLRVERIRGEQITCRVVVGGLLRSQKGLNMPDANIKINPITERDLQAIDFGLKHDINIFGLSFVEKAADVHRARAYAARKGKKIYLVSKIERAKAVENFDEILEASDAIMIARGDLGIEVPLEQVPIIQKSFIRKANLMSRPVITATQMLGSMTQNVRPTRAEVNDVANAIYDGTDAVMLSEETAVGLYPAQAIEMMARIATATEKMCHQGNLSNEVRELIRRKAHHEVDITDVISSNVAGAAKRLHAQCVIAQTTSGATARDISRFKPDCWILAFSPNKQICDFLNFSYGVFPFFMKTLTKRRPQELLSQITKFRLVKKGDTAIIAERRLSTQSGETDSLSIMKV